MQPRKHSSCRCLKWAFNAIDGENSSREFSAHFEQWCKSCQICILRLWKGLLTQSSTSALKKEIFRGTINKRRVKRLYSWNMIFFGIENRVQFLNFFVIFAFKVFNRIWGNNEQTLVAVVDKLSEKSCEWPGNSPTAEHTSAEIGTTSESRNSESEFILMALRSNTGLAVLGTSCKNH